MADWTRRVCIVLSWYLGAGTIASAWAVEPETAVRSAVPATRAGVEFFEKRIRPVLAAECYVCHSAQARKLRGRLRLDTPAGIMAGGASGPVVVPGNVEESLLISALRHDGLEMPPQKKLPESVIADFAHWVRLGAPLPA
ncbi:MAG: hypothetical protein C4297_06625 [Gemmataceae bacterium]